MSGRRRAAVDLGPLHAFLGERTPNAWVQAACRQLPLLLRDHANCEKKAASTALSMLYRYDGQPELVTAMSRLAREELRHFEQVLAIMRQRGIEAAPLSASRYAAGLRASVRSAEPQRLLDLLVCGAFVEARSCERFAALLPHLDAELAGFYGRLVRSEARHFETYLELGGQCADAAALEAAVARMRPVENALITETDEVLRFHSGPPGPLPSQASKASSSTASSSARA